MNSPLSTTSRDNLSGMRQASDDLMGAAGKLGDSTRAFAHDTLDQAGNKARHKAHDLGASIDPMVDMLAGKAQKLARQSLDLAAEAKDRAQQSLAHATTATTRYVAEQPLRSILMAAAVGAAVALLVSSARHRQSKHY